MTRKIFIYVSILSLVISCFSFTVFAGTGDQVITNLLPADNYGVRASGTEYIDSAYPGGSTKATAMYIRWNNAYSSSYFDWIYINIRSTSPLTTVRFSDEGTAAGATCELVGSYDGLYQYRINSASMIFSVFLVRIHFEGSVNGIELLIDSCYGVSNNIVPTQTASYYAFYRYIDYGNPDRPLVSQFRDVGDYQVETLPYTFYKERNDNGGIYKWSYESFYVDLYEFEFEFKNIDKVTFLFASHYIDEVYASLRRGDATDVLPVSYREYQGTTKIPNIPSQATGSNHFNVNYYEITVDLSSVNMEIPNQYLSLQINLEPWAVDIDTEFVYISCYGIYYSPITFEVPWYQSLWNWMKGGFDSVNNTLHNLLGDSSGGALGQAAGEMTQQAEEMDQANEVLNNVQRPDLNPDDLFGDSLNFSPGGMMVLTSLTNNSVITPILLVVCTFALVGFIFFGKKG